MDSYGYSNIYIYIYIQLDKDRVYIYKVKFIIWTVESDRNKYKKKKLKN